MHKGDIRKKQILETAEKLFSEQGYESTGVQDILNELHLSKGSFYHHFESKEQVLNTICTLRAEKAAEKLKETMAKTSSDSAQKTKWNGLEKMDRLLSGMIPFQGEGLAFLKMILPVFTLPEGKSIRIGYQAALKRCWLPMVEDALNEMIGEGNGYCFHPSQTAAIALDLINDLWDQIGENIILTEKRERKKISPGLLLNMVEPYRPALENLFSAPYGSLELIHLEELSQVVQQFHDWWITDIPE